MLISARDARERLADIEKRYNEGTLRKEREWREDAAYRASRMYWGDEDWTSPEGYDYSPDMGVHQFDGGGTFF